jgi:hypothetical protein
MFPWSSDVECLVWNQLVSKCHDLGIPYIIREWYKKTMHSTEEMVIVRLSMPFHFLHTRMFVYLIIYNTDKIR